MKLLLLLLVVVVELGVVSAQFKNILDDPYRKSCRWTYDTTATYTLDGDSRTFNYFLQDWDFPSVTPNTTTLYDRIHWLPENHVPKPPKNWDGSESTLGYPFPDKGSEFYKYLVCWPAIPNHILGATDPSEWNIKQDLDRIKCFDYGGWSSTYGKRDTLTIRDFNPPGGFPEVYELVSVRKNSIVTYTVNSSPEYQRPTQDWDGRKSTLGFPVPAKGTPHYNMLLCWPYDIRQN